MSENLYGIDSLKKVIRFPIKFGMSIENALEDDDKISVGEWLGIAPAAISNLISAITNFKEAGLEYKDLTQEERQELIDYVKDEYVGDDGDIELLVEDCFAWLVATDGIIHRIRNIIKKDHDSVEPTE